MALALRASLRPVARMTGGLVRGRCGPGARGATSAVSMVARHHAVAGLASDLTLHKSHGVPPVGAWWIRGLPHPVPASELVVRSEPSALRGRLVRATTRAPGVAGTATVGHATTHPPDSHCETRPLRSRLRRPPRRSRRTSELSTPRRGGGRPGRYSIATARLSFGVVVSGATKLSSSFLVAGAQKVRGSARDGRRRGSPCDHWPLDRVCQARSTAFEISHEGRDSAR